MDLIKSTTILMGLTTLLLNLFSCSDSRSGFKPGVFTERGYYVKNRKVYFYGGFSNASLIELKEANAEKFQVFNQRFPTQEFALEYAGDDKLVYYLGQLIPGADSPSFEILEYGLGKDKDHVYAQCSSISNDPENFQKTVGGLFKDRSHVYYRDRIVSDDPQNLKYLGKYGHIHYYSDSKGIIANDIRIDSVHIETFKPIAFGYAVDKSNVFLIEDSKIEVLREADAASLTVVSPFYVKDKASVFWRGKKLQGADPTTFRILSEEHHCSFDHNAGYYRDLIIPNTNPSKFPADKKFKYCNEREIVFDN
jgi:hypothetical protein